MFNNILDIIIFILFIAVLFTEVTRFNLISKRFHDDKLNELYSSEKGKKLVDAKKRTSVIIIIVLVVLIFWQGIMVFH